MLFLAKEEHRSLAQTAMVLMKEGLEQHWDSMDRRRNLLRNFSGLGVDTTHLSDPEELIREDRDRR
jgi:hypothetical protein